MTQSLASTSNHPIQPTSPFFGLEVIVTLGEPWIKANLSHLETVEGYTTRAELAVLARIEAALTAHGLTARVELNSYVTEAFLVGAAYSDEDPEAEARYGDGDDGLTAIRSVVEAVLREEGLNLKAEQFAALLCNKDTTMPMEPKRDRQTGGFHAQVRGGRNFKVLLSVELESPEETEAFLDRVLELLITAKLNQPAA